MSFIFFALKNPFRNKLRTFFVVIFLAIGLIAMISSVSFSLCSTELLDNTFNIGGYDIAITGESNLSMDELNKIKEINGVQSAVGVNYYKVKNINSNEIIFNSFFGKDLTNNEDIEGIGNINLIEGTLLSETLPNQIILTKETADISGKKVGDVFSIEDITPIQTSGLNPTDTTTQNIPQQVKADLKVVGIIDNIPEAKGIISFQTANKLLYNSSNHNFNTIFIKTQFNQFKQVKTTLKQTYSQTAVDEDTSIDMLKDMFFYIALLFVGIGMVIMMVATSKSVSERVKELGVLKALGWSDKRILIMLLIESYVHIILGWGVAIIMTLIILGCFLPLLPQLKELSINMPILRILGVSFIFSLLIPLFGCLIPLFRVARLKPTEAFKYE